MMAANGYMLAGRLLFLWKLAPCQPGDYCFSADYSWLSGVPEFETYKEIFAMAGWVHICNYNGHYIFCAPKGTKPIYTDKSTLADKYKRKIIINIIAAICLSIAHIGIQVLLFDSLINLLTSRLFWIFYFPLGVFPYLWCMCQSIIIKKRIKRNGVNI